MIVSVLLNHTLSTSYSPFSAELDSRLSYLKQTLLWELIKLLYILLRGWLFSHHNDLKVEVNKCFTLLHMIQLIWPELDDPLWPRPQCHDLPMTSPMNCFSLQNVQLNFPSKRGRWWCLHKHSCELMYIHGVKQCLHIMKPFTINEPQVSSEDDAFRQFIISTRVCVCAQYNTHIRESWIR